MQRKDLIAFHRYMCNNAESLMRSKNQDYAGGTTDPFANFRGSTAFGIHPATGIIIRMQDKLMRIQSLITNGELAVKSESLIDTGMDIINYSVLLVALLNSEEIPEEDQIAVEGQNGT